MTDAPSRFVIRIHIGPCTPKQAEDLLNDLTYAVDGDYGAVLSLAVDDEGEPSAPSSPTAKQCAHCGGAGYLIPTFAIGLVDPLPRHTCAKCEGTGEETE